MSKVDVGGTEIVFEEATDDLTPSKFPKKPESALSLWLVNKKITKNATQAKLLLISLSLFMISCSIVLVYFSTLYTYPQPERLENISPK